MSTSITRVISQDLYEALVASGATGSDPLVTQANLDGAVEVIEGANLAALPGTGEAEKLYVTLDTNNIYRWDGATYVQVGSNGAGTTNLGYTASPTNGTVTSDTGTDATLPLVDAVNAGLMAPADKTKLDGISGTNTGDQTATTTPVTPTGDLTSTNVQDALTELQGDIDNLETNQHDALTLDTDLDTTGQAANLVGQELELKKATPTTDGVMSSEDKTKLDAIETGATGDQSAAEVPVTPTGNLTSTDVQAALQELQGDIDGIVDTDDQTATEVPYTNTTSGLTATNVQDALDEIEARVDTNDAKVSNVTTDLGIANKTATTLDVTSSDGTDATIPAATITEAGLLSAADKTKLDGITDTDDQTAAEVSYDNATSGLTATNVQTAVDEIEGRIDSLEGDSHTHANKAQLDLITDGDHDVRTDNPHGVTKTDVGLSNVDNVQQIPLSQKGNPNGVAELDGTGKVPASQLPSFVDDVEEYADLASFPATGEAGKIYVALDTNKIYRWTGSVYVEISADAGAPVTSVNTQTGAVVLDADDIDDTSTAHKFVTAGDLTTLSNTSGVNSGDQVASTVSYNNSTSGLTATTTQAAIDEVEARVDANDAKVSADGSIDTHSDVDTTGKLAGDVLKWNGVSGQWEASTPTGGHDPLTLGGVANDTTDDTLDLTGQVLTVNLATQSTDGAMSAADKTKVDNLLSTKSGNVAVGAFTGNPKIAPVTFATAYPDANYSIILTSEVDNANASYVLSYLNKTASGFTISTGTNSTANLMSVDWTTIYYGESE